MKRPDFNSDGRLRIALSLLRVERTVLELEMMVDRAFERARLQPPPPQLPAGTES